MRSDRFLLAAVFACFLAPNSAMACQGQAGKTLFEDDFSDDSGGWDLSDPNTKIDKSALTVSFNGKTQAYRPMVAAFNVAEGDFCVDFVMPPSPAAGNVYGAGLDFWRSDANNFYDLELFSNGNVTLYRIGDGKFTLVGGQDGAPGFRSEPSATNELRAVVKGGKVTLYLNGNKLKVFRIQQPDGPLHFAVVADVTKPDASLTPIRFTHFKVTGGEQETAP